MRVVRVFLSTPSDVDLERVQVKELVRDINETVQFLAPAREMRFEVVHYETHAFPDIGAPQAVIDRQIPVDYDLYLGIMWERAGTPTGDAASGTIHEFEEALKHREAQGWPVIMFFFCDEDIAFPSSPDELDQLRTVLEFRQRLSSIGYTVAYGDRAQFREALRPRLLRAFADIVAADRRGDGRAPDGEPVVPAGQQGALSALAEQYVETRRSMPSGTARTSAMARIFNSMVELAATTKPLLHSLQASPSPGERLAAIAILHAFPDVEQVDWLAERLDNPEGEAPFVGYQAAVALGLAARGLRPDELPRVAHAVDRALELARQLPSDSDRIRSLEHARDELARRRARAGVDGA